MEDMVNMNDSVGCFVSRSRNPEVSKISPKGFYTVECRDSNGNLKWVEKGHNMVTDQGINNILDTMFGSPAKSSWFMGLIDQGGGVTLAAGDTHAVHAGWTENTAYTSTTRPAWTVGAASSKQVVNSTAVTFTVNSSGTINGIFLANLSTKGSVAGANILWATASFGSPQAVLNADILNITYTVQGA